MVPFLLLLPSDAIETDVSVKFLLCLRCLKFFISLNLHNTLMEIYKSRGSNSDLSQATLKSVAPGPAKSA